MIEIALLSAGTLLLLALAFTGVSVVALLTYSFPGRIFQGLFLGTACVSVLSTILTGRILNLGDSGLEVIEGSTLIGKLLLLVLAGVAFSVCVAWWLWRLGNKHPPLRYTSEGLVDINRLTWYFIIFYVAFSLLPLAFAPKFAFQASLVYPLFVWLALLLAIRTTAVDPVLVIRQALSLIVLSSLIAAIVKPSLVLQPGYASLIPGFNLRLWGVTSHANSLGAVSGILLVLQFIEKPRHFLLHHSLTFCVLVALLLTQSKSSIAGAFLGLAVLFIWRIWFGSKLDGKRPKRVLLGTIALLFLGATALGVVWLAINDPSLWYAVERRLDPRAVGLLSTFSNRLQIWEFAFWRGMESPLFGQGLSMWDLQTRLSIGMTSAVSAHNMFLQTFSRAGLFGLVTLLFLLAAMIRFAAQAATFSSGGSVALLAMFFARSVTESSLQPTGILGAEFFTFMALLVFSSDRAMLARKAIVLKTTISQAERFKERDKSEQICRANVVSKT